MSLPAVPSCAGDVKFEIRVFLLQLLKLVLENDVPGRVDAVKE